MTFNSRLGAGLAAACLFAQTACGRTDTYTAAQTGAAREHLTADTPMQTVSGATFVAPANWSTTVRGPATILEPPEGDSHLALVDVHAPSADSAVALAWAAYMPDHKWPLLVVTPEPDREGWTDRRSYSYQTSPNEKRGVGATAQRAGDLWNVSIYDMSDATGEKRLGAVARGSTLRWGTLPTPRNYKSNVNATQRNAT